MSLFHDRRAFLRGTGAGGLVLFAARGALAETRFVDTPFTLGVASGDPLPDGFVIWTRLAPDPLQIGSGMPTAPVAVRWEVSADAAFTRIERGGEAVARPELAHAVHVEVEGLRSNRPYFYRFTAGGQISPTGKARTAPATGATVAHARFGVAGCQHYEHGRFTAYRHLAEEDVDFIYCYGDYIYEGGASAETTNRDWTGRFAKPRSHLGGEIYSLDDYRRRYAQYKLDPDLQRAHAAAPWFVSWDDHEVDNNWVSAYDQDGTPPEVFALRRQAAMQAFYEHMPLRRSSFPVCDGMQLYRRAGWGDLLDLTVLDTRQYRTDQPCADEWNKTCAAIDDASAQVLGDVQEAWLFQGLDQSQARWKVLAQQVMMMDLNRRSDGQVGYNLDSWVGYRTPRARLLQHLNDRAIGDVVVLTGDEHQNFAGELYLDGRDMSGAPIATEFVATSITSGGDGVDQRPEDASVKQANPQLKFNNSQRGYVICDVDHTLWRTAFRVVDKVSVADGLISTRATLATVSGDPRILRA